MKKIKIALLILCVPVCGCNPVIKLVFGVRDPKPEDSVSLTKYLLKKKIATDNILVFEDSISLEKKYKEIKGIPEIQVFDKEGILIYHRDTGETCNGPAYDFTKVICTTSGLKRNEKKNIQDETRSLVSPGNVPANISVKDEYDYYVFIYWARYTGRLNKDHVKVWENNLKNVKGCRVKVYKVDMDWQKRWYGK